MHRLMALSILLLPLSLFAAEWSPFAGVSIT
jgi:hypothetical protein